MKVLNLITMVTLLNSLAACNQEEFYEKEFLEGAGKAPEKSETSTGKTDDSNNTENDDNTSGTIVDSGNTGSGSGSGTGTGTGTGSGSGTAGGGTCDQNSWPVVNDGFTQAVSQEGKIDILWVVDDSGSMGDEQDELAYNFDAFINDFITRQTDFRMGITTTDTSTNSRSGALKGRILTSADAATDETAFKNDFKNFIKVGTNGSGDEKGLKASSSFLNKHGSNFLRNDAYLIVVYISDEQDDSENAVTSYINTLKSYKTNAGLLKAYSIVNTEEQANQWEEIGTRYIEASNATSGTVSNIKQDFYQVLSQMGGDIIDLLDSFALSQAAVANTIQVSVGGTVVADGWSYNAQNNTIKFSGNAIPAAGTAVSVSYKVNNCQ